ncbi:MAG: hypothetical protein ACKVQJ_13915 [Pyrinomonadaceae bacterium]
MTKLLKWLSVIILVIVAAVAIPVSFRRYQNGQLAQKINLERADAANRPKTPDQNFDEYKGVIHVHTSLGGHSTGGFDELISAANTNGLDFVLMTEHSSDAYDTSTLTLNGVYGKTLFIGGNEIDTADGDRFLVIPGTSEAGGFHALPTNTVVEKLHAGGRIALVAYPEKFRSWSSNFDGAEVFSLNTNSKQTNPFVVFFDLLWSFQAYPSVTMATYSRRPDTNLAQFDLIAAKRRVTLFAGIDAHSNIGFHLIGDDAGNKMLNLKLDPYAMIFQIVRMHVLLERTRPMTKENLIEAVRKGNFYTGFDVIGDTDGFRFAAESVEGSKAMGDEIVLTNGTRLTAQSPLPARFVVLKNGEKFYEATAAEMTVAVTEKAAYRVEVYRDDLGPPFDKMPWIMSNPIYVK